MSSYYTAAQLEAMRKEKIKKELADSIQRLSIQLQEKHDNSVHISSAGNIELSVFAIDDTTSGSEGTDNDKPVTAHFDTGIYSAV